MIKALINGILNIVSWVVNLILTPINLLIANLFPDMNTAISNFNNVINNYVGNTLSWASNFIPPLTKNMVVLALTFMITYYGVIWTYTMTIKVFNIIRKIKFW